MSLLAGIVSGYLDTDQSLSRKKRIDLENDEIKRKADADKADRQAVEEARRYSMASGGVTPTTTPTSAVAAEADPVKTEINRQNLGGSVGPAPQLPQQSLPPMKIEGNRDWNEMYRKQRDYLLSKGRTDLAGKIDEQWNNHLSGELKRVETANLTALQGLKSEADQQAALKTVEANNQEMMGLVIRGMQLPATRGQALKTLERMNQSGQFYDPRQRPAGITTIQGSDTRVFVDDQGQPLRVPGTNQPLTIPADEFDRLMGGGKMQVLKEGDKVGRFDRKGGMEIVGENPKSEKPDTEKANYVRQQVNTAVQQLGLTFGVKLDPTGRMLDAEAVKNMPWFEQAAAEAAAAVRSGVEPYAAARDIADKYRRRETIEDPKKGDKPAAGKSYKHLW